VRICSGGAPENSNIITMTVSGTLAPSVAIASSAIGTICSGTYVTFTSSAVNPGSMPVYQWKVNGATVGSGDSYTYAPSNGDSVRCILTSSLLCALPAAASSSTIFMSVSGSSTLPSVTINATPGSAVCEGVPVTFNALATMGGATPFYQWKVNGLDVGTGGHTFSYIPSGGDLVTCHLTSSSPCLSSSSATSNTIAITTLPFNTPSISIAGPIGAVPGSTVTLNALVADVGSSYQIDWMNYGVVFNTTSMPTVTYTKTTGTDVLTAKLASTSTGCYDTTTSGIILVQATTSSEIDEVTSADIQVYPNPAKTLLTVTSPHRIFNVNIANPLGQTVYQRDFNTSHIQLDIANLSSGVYFLKINGTKVIKILKD
jgi:hypothetical protein